MSLPNGSKELSSSIGPSNVYYLIGENEVLSTFTSDNFSRPLGRPFDNCETINIDPNIIKTIEESLPETKNSAVKLFDTFPNILDNDPDITVDDTYADGVDIEVTFVSEGAGYLNAFGYYFYYINGSGQPKIITNADSNINSNENDPYYRPTIVFPNASFSRSGGQLVSGMTRKLKGNLPSGKFKNVKVGFFLIPNGWKTSSNGYLSTGTGHVMHTTWRFNSNYNASYLNETNVAKHDTRRGIQSAILWYVDSQSWILSFEDILRPSGDSDYNDLVLLVKKTPVPDATELSRYTAVAPSATINTKGQTDSDGQFLWLNHADTCNNGTDLICDRKIYFKEADISYKKYGETITVSPKEYVKSIMEKLNWNYVYSGVGIVEETSTTITQRFRFRPADIANNRVTTQTYDKVKLYLLSRAYNVDNTTHVNDVGGTNYSMLLDYQSVFVDLWYSSPGNSKYINREDFTFKCGTVENSSLRELNTNFEKSTLVLLAWGDPHIQQLDGSSYKMPDDEGTYILLNNSNILIEAQTFKSPHTEQIPELKGTTFFKKITIDVKNKSKFEINLDNFEFCSQGNFVRHIFGYDKKALNNITDPYMRECLNNDPSLICLSVFIEGLKVTFVKLPTIIDVQNIVLFDMESLKYYGAIKSIGGMVSRNELYKIDKK